MSEAVLDAGSVAQPVAEVTQPAAPAADPDLQATSSTELDVGQVDETGTLAPQSEALPAPEPAPAEVDPASAGAVTETVPETPSLPEEPPGAVEGPLGATEEPLGEGEEPLGAVEEPVEAVQGSAESAAEPVGAAAEPATGPTTSVPALADAAGTTADVVELTDPGSAGGVTETVPEALAVPEEPLGAGEEPLEAVEEPLGAGEEPLGAVEEPVEAVQGSAESVAEPVVAAAEPATGSTSSVPALADATDSTTAEAMEAAGEALGSSAEEVGTAVPGATETPEPLSRAAETDSTVAGAVDRLAGQESEVAPVLVAGPVHGNPRDGGIATVSNAVEPVTSPISTPPGAIVRSLEDAIGGAADSIGVSTSQLAYGALAASAVLGVAAARAGLLASTLATCQGLSPAAVWRAVWKESRCFAVQALGPAPFPGGASARAGRAGVLGARSRPTGGAAGETPRIRFPIPGIELPVPKGGLPIPARAAPRSTGVLALLGAAVFLLGLAALPARTVRWFVPSHVLATALPVCRLYLAATGLTILLAATLVLLVHEI